MSALAGVYDPRVAADGVQHILATMQRPLAVPSLPQRTAVASAFGAGCVTVEHDAPGQTAGIASDAGQGLWLVLVGELVDRERLRARLGKDAVPPEDDAHLCLRLYLHEGPRFVEHLNGHFNIVLYREADRHLSIVTDPFGYRPLFLAADGQRYLFASEMKAILAVLGGTPTVDGIGLLELTRQRWPLGNRTWIEAIQVMTPGTWYEMTPGRVSPRRYYRFGFCRDQTLSFASYVEGFADTLRRVSQRTMRDAGRVGLALSGGLDSRSLLLASGAEAQHLLAYTFGRSGSRDIEYAIQLAQIAGVPHLHLTYGPGYLGRCLAAIVWRTEGLLPFSSATFTSLHFHSVLAERADALVYGHAGDALTGAHLPPRALLWRSKEPLIERIVRQYNRMPEALVRRVFCPTFYRRFATELYESLRASFADIEEETMADVFDVWDMENRQRRGTFASTAVDRYRFGVRAPFLDRELVDHLRHAPPRWRVQQLAYKRMIATAFPDAASVPWAHTGGRLPTHRLSDFAAQARSYVERRVRGAGGAVVGSNGTSPSFRNLDADTRADRALAQVIRDFASSALFPAEVFDRSGIEEVVHRHWEGGEDLTPLVSILATVATAYRLFIWQRPQAMPPEAIPPP